MPVVTASSLKPGVLCQVEIFAVLDIDNFRYHDRVVEKNDWLLFLNHIPLSNKVVAYRFFWLKKRIFGKVYVTNENFPYPLRIFEAKP